jgi:hypothetical protein
MNGRRWWPFWLAIWVVSTGAAAPLPRFEFTQMGGLGWEGAHDVEPIQNTMDGMLITITGSDPYVNGPPRDFPEGQRLTLQLRARCDEGGTAQVFYFREMPSEQDSLRFTMGKGEWEDFQLPLPALGPAYRIRFDPPGTTGKCLLEFVRFSPRKDSRPDPPLP